MNVFRPLAPLSCLLVFLVACAQPPTRAPEPPGGQACQAGPAQFAVGRQLTEALVQEAQRRSGAGRARVLRPGEVRTMEFDERRLNLEVDSGSRVIRSSCG